MLKKQVKVFETAIIEAMVDGEDLKSVDDNIDKVAKLKAEATRVHLKCISSSLSL